MILGAKIAVVQKERGSKVQVSCFRTFGLSDRTVAWVVVVALLSGGCTTLKPSQLPPEQLRAEIRNGSILQVGDEASIVTDDGAEHILTVTALETDAIVGNLEGGAQVTIPIDDVLAVRTQETDGVRTALAAVGGYVIVWGAVATYALMSMFDDLLDLFE